MVLRFRGARQLRQRLVFATLAGRSIRVDGIRSDDPAPGLRDYEASLLRLLEKVTNGCLVEINETGVLCWVCAGCLQGRVVLCCVLCGEWLMQCFVHKHTSL
jgi:RNA 3'-terminal phosphate cyclase-like protein